MFVALRNFSAAEGKYFCTGEIVPDQFVTDRTIELGCVAKVKQAKEEAKPLTETVKEESKQILTEDTSDVQVEVTETKKSKKK